MKRNLSIGCNYTQDHVNAITDLVRLQIELQSENVITGVYGSPGLINPFGSVRPRRREVEIGLDQYKYHSMLLRNSGIRIAWTMNSLTPDYRSGYALDDMVPLLVDMYDDDMFDMLIVSHPALLDDLAKHDIPVMISTVMNVHGIAQVKAIKSRWPNVKKICTALWRNRDIEWLKRANAIIPLELLANEFCSLGGVECEGLYRQACYLSQSMDTSNWNPMDVCRPSRFDHPEAWLKAKFILPDWLETYQKETGVSHFKITGRTHPADFLRYVGEMYIRGKGHGNLLALWGQLEATYADAKPVQGQVQNQALQKYPNIPIERIVDTDYFMNPICNSENCSDTCEHCKRLYEKIVKEQTDGQ